MSESSHSLTPMRRRAVDRLLVQYLELADTKQTEFIHRCRCRFPRLCRWLDRLVEGGHTVTLLDDSVRQVADDAMQSRVESEQRAELPPGTEIGPWRIVEVIGQGGMGMVYRGERADGAFEMDVAIKLIGKRKRGLAELLQRECRLLARLDHPSVTRLMDAGLDDRAGPFLVMEWVEGTDLDAWLKQNNPSLEQRLALFIRLAEATAHSHQRLIVHGDIKPGNVRVRADGTVKLMDFGVARLLRGDKAEAPGLHGLTPSFAAPEQIEGEEITPRSDVWSLGILLYWLLTGESAPRNDTDAMTQSVSIRYRRGRELAAMLAKACQLDPRERYQNVSDLALDINRFRTHYPVSPLANEPRYRITCFLRRNPALAGGIFATFAALTVGLTATTLLYMEAEQSRLEALQERDRAERHAWELEQIAEFQEARLADIDAGQMGRNMRESLVGMVTAALKGPVDPALSPDLILERFEGALDEINFTDYALSTLDRNLFGRTRAAIDRQFANEPLIRARLLHTLAVTLREVGLLNEALDPQKEAFEIRLKHLGPYHSLTLLSMLHWAQINLFTGRFDQALDLMQQRLELQLATIGEDHPDTLTTLNSLGSVHFYRGELEETESYYRQALAGRKAVLGEDHEDTAFTMTGLGALLREKGDLDGAEYYLRRALERLIHVHGEDHHRSRNTLGQIASTMIKLERYEDARDTFERLHAIEQRVLGDRHPDTLATLHRIARLDLYTHSFKSAADILGHVVNSRQETLGATHPHTLESMRLKASLFKTWHEVEPDADHAERTQASLPPEGVERQLDVD